MREFRDMGAFADHLARLAAESTAVTHHLTEETAKDVEKVAKAEIGHYQPAVGPFAKWEQLKPETEAEKKRLGFQLNAPLERTGEMRDSIEHRTIGNEAAIGSNDDKMVWHELGTPTVPARAVLGPAAIRVGQNLQARFGRVLAAWLAGRGWRRPRLK